VHDRVDAVLGDRRAHGGRVVHAGAHERQAARGLDVAGREVVEHDHVVPGGGERLGGMAADVAGAARDEHARHAYLPIE